MNKKKWSENQILILKKTYANGKKEELISKIGKSWCSILCKAQKLNLKREILELKNSTTIGWSSDEIKTLKENYFNLNKKEIEKKLPGRSWSSIQQKAFALGIKREIAKNSDLSVLLQDTCETYYWLGFLMADGHFNKYSIQINLAKKDIGHLKKFAKFISYKKKLNKPSLYVNDKEIVDVLKLKFKITNNKTYEPCSIFHINDEKLLLSLIAGFIDGDGSIKQSYGRTQMVVKCHKSWRNNLDYMLNFLCAGFNKSYKTVVNKEGLAIFFITDIEVLKKIKSNVYKLKLPILKRKWGKINLNKLSKKEKSNKLIEKCLDAFKKGMTPKDVIKSGIASSSFCYKVWSYYNS